MNKDFIVFDWEVFPEWNCIVWNKYDGDFNHIQHNVITSDDENYISALKHVIYLGYSIGFNIKSYDMQIFNFAILGYTPEELYEHSMSIMNSTDGKYKDITYWRKYNFTDLYDDIKGMGSLKQFESNTGMKIKESDVPFGTRNLTPEQKENIIFYCKDDVTAENSLVKARWGYLTSKANCSKISKLSEAECLKNTSAKVCAKMLGAKQAENCNPPYYTIPERLDKLFREILHPKILEQFDNQSLDNEFTYTVNYFKNLITFGAGGAHSTYGDNIMFISNEEELLMCIDFENLYPALLVLFNYYASGISEEGKKQFEYILENCRKLKQVLRDMRKQGLKNAPEYTQLFEERDSAKLIMNAATGAMRAKFSALYDPQNIIALCFTGQLLTTCIAKLLHNNECVIIQTNTDGVIFKAKRSKLIEIKMLISEVSTTIGIPLEIDEEYAIFQKDVNNYVMIASKDSDPKRKGRWAKESGSEVPLTPLFAPIINQSVIDSYLYNIPIEESIKNCKVPLDFMMTTMKGPTFDMVVHEINNNDQIVQNVNRVYASTNKKYGTVYKVKIDKETGEIIKHDKTASIPDHCAMFNDAVTDDLIIEDLDYDWYIDLAKRHMIEMKQIV